jgi:hypothetical protein
MDKFICKHCGFSLTIKKSSDTQIIKISTPTEFINATKNDDNVEYDISLEKSTLETYMTKKTFKPDEKVRLLNLYIQMAETKRSVTKYVLKCSTCGSEYPLLPETIIYSLNFKKQQSIFNDVILDLKLYDPTLPRTKDYICTNSECPTHLKTFDQTQKEAVFYRAEGSYHLKYACLCCKTNWLV